MIPLCIPDTNDAELEAVAAVLKSGWLVHGPVGAAFEKEFAAYVGAHRAVALNSCTAALHLALLTMHRPGETAANVLDREHAGGEVILPSFTFVASANAIVQAGYTPVFVDIDPYTCNVDASCVEEAITEHTVALMPVHYAGQCADMMPLLRLADQHRLTLIEDSAEAIGATYGKRRTGSFGLGCFSFFATKNMTTGEGGMLTTQDDDTAEAAIALRGHGIPSGTWQRNKADQPWKRNAIYPGFNFRMPDILAAIGRVQLGKLDAMNTARRRHAAYLHAHLPQDELLLPVEQGHGQHVYQMYTVQLTSADVVRDRFVQELRARGVGASVHFDPPAHLHDYYRERGCTRVPLPITEMVANRIVTLPMYPTLTEDDLKSLVRSVKEALVAARR